MGIDVVNFLATTSLILFRRHRGVKLPGPTLHVRLHETGYTEGHPLVALGGTRVSASPTLVGSDSMKRVLMKGK